MYAMAILLASTATGVDYGWEPNPNGEMEYIIQLEPALAEAFMAGEPIRSVIPPQVDGVRAFRIQVGQDPLPQENTALSPPLESVDLTPQPTPHDSPFRTIPDPVESPPFITEPIPEEPEGSPSDPVHFPTPERSLDPPAVEDEEAAIIPIPDRGRGGLFNGFPSGQPETHPPQPFEPQDQAEQLASHDDPVDENDNHSHESSDEAHSHEEEHAPPVAIAEEEEKQAAIGTKTKADAPKGRPWFPLVLTALLLFASVGVNIYLFWILRETLSRYRQLFREQKASPV